MTPWVTRLLIANVAMFFVSITMPAFVGGLVLVPALVLTRPWTLVTYMFLHGGIGHLFFNMLALYFFGPRIEERLGSGRFFQLYLVSGLMGAALSFFFTPFARIVGASGAIFGVMFAFARFWPRERIYIWGVLPIEARLLVIITTVLALWGGFSGSRSGTAHFAHLGGYLGGWLYLWWLERQSPQRKFQAKIAAANPKADVQNWRSIERSSVHEVNRAEVDRILDKISAQGIDSLTSAERTFLSHFTPKDDRPLPKQ